MSNTEKTYTRDRTKKERRAEVLVGLVVVLLMILLAYGGIWAFTGTMSGLPVLLRIGVAVFAVISVGKLLRMALQGFLSTVRSEPITLIINGSGIRYEVWRKTWSEIGQAKIVGPGLVFYDKDQADKPVLRVPVFDAFEASNEIVELVSEKLGKPVIRESPQK